MQAMHGKLIALTPLDDDQMELIVDRREDQLFPERWHLEHRSTRLDCDECQMVPKDRDDVVRNRPTNLIRRDRPLVRQHPLWLMQSSFESGADDRMRRSYKEMLPFRSDIQHRTGNIKAAK